MLHKVKEPVVVSGASCCTTLDFSDFLRENDLFLVGFRAHKGWPTIGICLDAPKSDCLKQVWVNRGLMGPQEEFSLLLRSQGNQSKVGRSHGNEVRWPRETLIRTAKSFASPICIPWAMENHASLPSNMMLSKTSSIHVKHHQFTVISMNGSWQFLFYRFGTLNSSFTVQCP